MIIFLFTWEIFALKVFSLFGFGGCVIKPSISYHDTPEKVFKRSLVMSILSILVLRILKAFQVELFSANEVF
jgi:hypothetical protein